MMIRILRFYYLQSKYKSRMSLTAIQIFSLALLISAAFTQSIVDYTYAQHLIGQKAVQIKHFFNIHPNRKETSADFQLPNGCKLIDKLSENIGGLIQDVGKGDSDQFLNDLKNNMTKLLRVSQKIKKIKATIIDQRSVVNKDTSGSLKVSEETLNQLKILEDKLLDLNKTIEQKQINLRETLSRIVQDDHNAFFTKINLDYEKAFHLNKIAFLEGLQSDLSDPTAQGKYDQNKLIQNYYDEIHTQFDIQNELVKDMYQLFETYGEMNRYRLLISNLNSHIEAHTLLAQEMQKCAADKDKVLDNKKVKEIQETVAHLKSLKEQENTELISFCEGVTKKLTRQVKGLLRIYNITYSCSEKYEQTKKQLQKFIDQRQEAKQKLKELDEKKDLKKFQDAFKSNRQFVAQKIKDVSIFELDNYQHSNQSLSSLIQKHKQKIIEIDQKLNSLSEKQSKPFDYSAIQDQINEIKMLKGRYCSERTQYEQLSIKIQKAVEDYRSARTIAIQGYRKLRDSTAKLRDLENEFSELKKYLLINLK